MVLESVCHCNFLSFGSFGSACFSFGVWVIPSYCFVFPLFVVVLLLSGRFFFLGLNDASGFHVSFLL
jgi:hypothetical protein